MNFNLSSLTNHTTDQWELIKPGYLKHFIIQTIQNTSNNNNNNNNSSNISNIDNFIQISNHQILNIEYHIIFSTVWNCPVLYFNVFNSQKHLSDNEIFSLTIKSPTYYKFISINVLLLIKGSSIFKHSILLYTSL